MMAQDTEHIALLRGVNLSGKNRLPMKELAEIFRQSGCRDVRTYIQSGNVVFTAEEAVAGDLPGLIERAVRDRFGIRTSVITRTGGELKEIVARNPFLHNAADSGTLHVAFLRDAPVEPLVEALDPDRSPPDAYVVSGREIYLRCPNGVARTRLTAQYFDSKLQTVSTMRNWRTVLKLRDMAGS